MIDHNRLLRFLGTAIDAGDPEASALASFEQTAAVLRKASLEAGDAVLLASTHGLGTVGAFFAVLDAGLVPVPHGPGRDDRLLRAASALQCRAVATLSGTGLRPKIDLRHVPTPNHAQRPYRPGEVVLLTSGTSGIATGCVHDIDALLTNGLRHLRSLGIGTGHRTLVSLPLYFSFALVAQVLAAFRSDSSIVLAPPPFTPTNFNAALSRYEIDVAALTPWLVRDLLSGDWQSPSSLRTLSVGGAQLPLDEVRRLRDRCNTTSLAITYGLTEAGPRVSTLLTDDVDDARLASVGLPIEGVRVVSPTVPGEVRELIVHTDTAMKRRVGALRRNQHQEQRGTVHTGDMFSTDEDGYLFFHERHRDIIVHHGSKLNLRSVRQLVEESPLVVYSRTRPTLEGYALDLFTQPTVDASDSEISRSALRRLTLRERPTQITVSRAERPHK
ncbi:class I adenylate-forming enzyme family protein [Nocardia sp. 004]|uniref:class I adenylate-forming enzyme family protein n=1 Tax=Nocardia sp. 004 TaxID=3385978 RepID=UPI0039A22AB2